MNLFADACDNFGLIINTEKTVVMHQPPPDAVYVAPQINMNGAQVQDVDNFPYLGTTIQRWIESTSLVLTVMRLVFFGVLGLSAATDVEPKKENGSGGSGVRSVLIVGVEDEAEVDVGTSGGVVQDRVSFISIHICLHCSCTFTSRIGPAGHLRIYRTETGELVLGAPTYIRRIRLHCLHRPPHIHSPHWPIRTHAHSPKPAADNRRPNHTVTSSPTKPAPHNNITRHKYPISTSHVSGKCASQFLLQVASLLHL
ncbi:hypothetical protein SprV_0301329300 [Sparganum proliferum]